MKKYKDEIIIVLLVFIFAMNIITIWKVINPVLCPGKVITTTVLQKQRDSLNVIDDSLHFNIITQENKYETIHNRIIGQSVDSDCLYFANYLSAKGQRLLDSNNCQATKTK